MPIEIRLLGGVKVELDGAELELTGQKQRQILAALALSAGQVLTSRRLIDLVWDRPPTTARRTLQSYIAGLRSVTGLEGAVRAKGGGYVLGVSRSQVDLLRFEDSVEDATARLDSDPELTRRQLEYWDLRWSQPLGEIELSIEMQAVLAPYLELRLQMTETLVEAQMATGHAKVAVRRLESLVRTHPTREAIWLQLARGLSALDRRDDALGALQRARERLREDFGVDPSSKLQELELSLLTGDVTGSILTTAQLAELMNPRARRLVGRADDLDWLTANLARGSVVTLVGPGGIGKTVLAMEYAAELRRRHQLNVAAVELASITDSADVIRSISSDIGLVQTAKDRVDAIVDHFAVEPYLLVLDSCERMIDTVADIVGELNARCPSLAVLVTSREPLGVRGERVWRVGPLDSNTDAVELFILRASEAGFDVGRDPTSLHLMQVMCAQLDGIPLAIELAAPRCRTLGLSDLAARVGQDFGALASRRGGERRHQSIDAVTDWSYRLLGEQQKRLFALLSVFGSGFPLAGAQHIGLAAGLSTDPVDVLSELVDQSLVEIVRLPQRTRYRMLEPVRQFAASRLVDSFEQELAKDAHARFFIESAEIARRGYTGERWYGGRNSFNDEWHNYRIALRHLLAKGDLDGAAQLVISVGSFASIDVRHEHSVWTGSVADAILRASRTIPAALAGQHAWWLALQSRYLEASTLARQGIEDAPSPTDPSTSRCWFALTLCLDDSQLIEQNVLINWKYAAAKSTDPFDHYLSAWSSVLFGVVFMRRGLPTSHQMINDGVRDLAGC